MTPNNWPLHHSIHTNTDPSPAGQSNLEACWEGFDVELGGEGANLGGQTLVKILLRRARVLRPLNALISDI